MPSEAAFEEIVAQAKDPLRFLGQAWNTGRIVHRQLVAGHLKRLAATPGQLDGRATALLVAAALDVDAEVREQALGALAAQKSPHLLRLAQAQLLDADPEVRLLGLRYLSKADPQQVLPIVVKFLDDSDLRIVATAETALKNWTQQDFGVRIHHSIPSRDDATGRESLDVAGVEAIKQGVQRRKAWWNAHKDDYPSALAAVTASIIPTCPRFRAADFALENLGGERVRLSDFRGKVVLLNFWTTWCTACLAEIPDLVELQKKHADQFVILGISLDGVPDSHGHTDGHDESNADIADHGQAVDAHEHAHSEPPSLAKIRAKVERVVKAKGINYPILLDPKSRVGSRFNGGELPTNVLIDADGYVRRRFIGRRSTGTFTAMIAEIARPVGASEGERLESRK
ncbi:MAG: redoxin domain-containing protein [Verrucomicrobia bacterium]|nr:redoxin domain-containing protein [Verrucomicrobiota bacterium]